MNAINEAMLRQFAMSSQPQKKLTPEDVVTLPSLGSTLAMAEIYAKVEALRWQPAEKGLTGRSCPADPGGTLSGTSNPPRGPRDQPG